MVTLAKRLEELRTRWGLTRPELAEKLGLARTAIEKFETGRQTPTKQQQETLAGFFGVSLFYLRGESDDPTRQGSWMDEAPQADDGPRPAPVKKAPQAAAEPGGGSVFESVMDTPKFRLLVQSAVEDFLRSPRGQELLIAAIRKETGRLRAAGNANG